MQQQSVIDALSPHAHERRPGLELGDGSRVAVIGGGPAGSFFSYFLLDMAGRVGMDINVDADEQADQHGQHHRQGSL